jgi:hypothetical protein
MATGGFWAFPERKRPCHCLESVLGEREEVLCGEVRAGTEIRERAAMLPGGVSEWGLLG